MSPRIDAVLELVKRLLLEPLGRLGGVIAGGARSFLTAGWRLGWRLTLAALLAGLAYGLCVHPPFATVPRSEVLVRTNVLDGSARAYPHGAAFY